MLFDLSIKEFIGIAAGILSFSSYSLYIFTTIFGKTRPNRATWWILTLIGFMIASSYYAGGARATIWHESRHLEGNLDEVGINREFTGLFGYKFPFGSYHDPSRY